MAWLSVMTAILVGYLLGSIPTGYLVARARGIDIQAVGSGNIGATNVFRILGTKAGMVVLAGDALKGWLACALAAPLGRSLSPPAAVLSTELTALLPILAGGAAILGHIYTFWLRFKGGKGVATTAGIMLALVPGALAISLVTWVLVFVASRFVSLASIAAAISLPFAAWFTGGPGVIIWLMAGIGVLAIYKHRANIQRLLAGTEQRLSLRRKPSSPSP